MPGEENLLKEFTANLKPRVIGQLAEIIFDKMKLAGEAGSLLKIEDEIQDAIKEAREEHNKEILLQKKQDGFLPGMAPTRQPTLFDFADLPDDEAFWDQAEHKILDALRDYAEHAEGGISAQKRLFAQDAAKGFAFIDLCRKRFDVILMNPPFGDVSQNILITAKSYKSFSDNIVAPFAEWALSRTHFTGIVLDRALLVRKTHEAFRELFLENKKERLRGVAIYGWEVLDANVEVAAIVASDIQNSFSFSYKPVTNSKDIQFVCNKGYNLLPNRVISGDIPSFIINAFANFEPLGNTSSAARVGNQWKSERYLRLWWENPSMLSFPVYNGGPYAVFYQLTRNSLVKNFLSEEIRNESTTVVRNLSFHNQPGIGYGKRGTYLDAHILPSGQSFSVEGLACFPESNIRMELLSYLNSLPVSVMLSFFCGQHKHVGYINKLPFDKSWKLKEKLLEDVNRSIGSMSRLLSFDETSPLFCHYKSLNSFETLADYHIYFFKTLDKIKRLVNTTLEEIDQSVTIWLGFPLNWKKDEQIQNFIKNQPRDSVEGIFNESGISEFPNVISRTLGFLLGVVYGFWDILFASGEKTPVNSPKLFDPLSVCPPGMLQNSSGLPSKPKDIPSNYPISIAWSGILVNEKGHTEDIITRIRETCEVIWKDKANDIEQEVCEILNIRSLREYFSKPSKFFADHLNRYSKSRRQAPVYWPLSIPSASYTLWLYYHRLSDQILYTCVNDFVDPKLKQVTEDAAQLRSNTTRSTQEEKDLEKLIIFELELTDFRDELLRIAKFWKPNLNDGVQITAAPLWKLFQHKPWQKKLKQTWEKLEKGDYDWAHLAYSIWPKRVKEKCKTDKSLAIAHDLEDLYEEPPEKPKKKRRTKAK